MAKRSKAWAAASRLLGLLVRFPPGAWMHVSCECCVLSGRGVLPSAVRVTECGRESSATRMSTPATTVEPRKQFTLRLLMSYIYIYIYIYIYMEHPFLMFLDHTQRRSTVGRTPLDE